MVKDICWHSEGFYTWAITFSDLHKRHCQGYIGSGIRLFADDTSIFIIIENPVCPHGSRKILHGAEMWFVLFNLDKSK